MALFKCKMCGGDLEIVEGASIAECEYCGTKQTVPKAIDENLQNLFNRANTLRIKSEFDKAEKLYEKIIQADSTQSEAYWGLILCKYGIEYVDDPATFKKVPTCHRASFESIVADEDYKSALENADMSQRALYEEQAKEIDRIQKDILALAQKEENYDVFICYKETGADGRRTQDSVIANDIYYQLTQEGFKVFYAAITLEGKLGSAYEPIIFAALNSAKVMLAIGTKPEYFNAVWVKNEWSRYLKIIKSDRSKLLIPCYRDMDAYELPEEFAHLQAQDMSKIGFINDVVRGIKKVIKKDEPKPTVVKETIVNAPTNVAPLLQRIFIFLEDEDWEKADEYCEKVLDIDPQNAQAYLGKLMVEFEVSEPNDLKACGEDVLSSLNYERASKYSEDKDDKTEKLLFDIMESIYVQECDKTFRSLKKRFDSAQSEAEFLALSNEFKNLSLEAAADVSTNYQEILRLIDVCNEKAKEAKLSALEKSFTNAYKLMENAISSSQYNDAAHAFKAINDYKNAAELAQQCLEKATIAEKDEILNEAVCLMGANSIAHYEQAIRRLKSIPGWKDSDVQVEVCYKKIEELKAQAEADRLERERQAEADRLERERQAEIERMALEQKKKKTKKVSIIIGSITASVIIFVIVLITVIIPGNKYSSGEKFIESGDYVAAMGIFKDLDYKDSYDRYCEAFNLLKSSYRETAEEYLNSGDKINAAIYYIKAGDPIKAKEVYDFNHILQAGEYTTSGIMSDGTFKFLTNYQYDHAIRDMKNLHNTKNIIRLFNGEEEDIVGVDESGKLYTTKFSFTSLLRDADKDYSNIKQIISDYDFTCYLTDDGDVFCKYRDEVLYSNFSSWKNIKEIYYSRNALFAIDYDGNVYCTDGSTYPIGSWKNIKKLGFKTGIVYGITNDSRIVSYRYDSYYPDLNVSGYTDVVDALYVSPYLAVLHTNGTVSLEYVDSKKNVAEEKLQYQQQIATVAETWDGIVSIQQAAGGLIGIRYDGTVKYVSTDVYYVSSSYSGSTHGYDTNSDLKEEIESWTDIVWVTGAAVDSFSSDLIGEYAVGIKSNGTVVATGDGTYSTTEENSRGDYYDVSHSGGTYHLVSDWKLW